MKTLAAAAVWTLVGALAYGVLAPHRFGLLAGGTAVLAVWIWINERRIAKINNPSPPPPADSLSDANPQFRVVEGDHPHHWRVIHGKSDREDA